jgi:hypothetical protein
MHFYSGPPMHFLSGVDRRAKESLAARPGSVLTRKHEDRQRKPDDLEAREGQND